MKYKSAALIACIPLIVSCAGVRVAGGVVTKPHAHYGVTLPPDAWQKEHFRGADLFFKHKTKDAMIFIKAQCEKISDSPLQALTAQILAGMGKYEIVSQTSVSLSEREGLLSEVTVKLDGVTRYLKIMVLRKNRCVFDGVLSARQYDPQTIKDFDDMIATFWAEADL